MKYDIFNDGLIVLWKNGSPIVTDNKKVDEFTIIYNGIPRRFVNLREAYPGIRGFAEIHVPGYQFGYRQTYKSCFKESLPVPIMRSSGRKRDTTLC